jgi:C-terminal processing protease CtpA/Prc
LIFIKALKALALVSLGWVLGLILVWKNLAPGGAAEIDGRIHVNDQTIEVDGSSFVAVTQAYAASVLRNTNDVVNFVIERDKDPENSEIGMFTLYSHIFNIFSF